MFVKQLSPTEWMDFSEAANQICFDHFRSRELNRVDYALLLIDNNKPQGFTTVKEMDAESAYLQYGGAFPGHIGTPRPIQAFGLMLNFLREKYKRVTCYVENDNQTMLKICMKFGFRIVGVKMFKQQVLVENTLEWEL